MDAKLVVPARTITSSLLLLGLSMSCSGEGNRTQATDAPAIFDTRFQDIRDFVVQEVADGSLPSLAIAVAHNGDVVWEEAFGLADKESGIRATPNTMYRLGSIAKPITATAVMRLAEAGRVDLDTPIEDYLGGLALHYYVGTPEEVTVRRVLQHRAGLPPHNQIFFLDEHRERRSFDETVRRYGNVMFQPGGSYIYSNLGYQLLARLVEEATGMDFPQYVRDSVFTPLGMMAAQVYVGDELRSPAAKSYYGANGEPVPRNLHAYPGAEDVYCSAHDLLRFAMFHLKNRLPDQAGVLADSTIDAMQIAEPPSNTRYGLGWYFDVDELGFRSLYHGGQTTGVSNLMAFVPSENLAYVILANTDYEASKLLRIHDGIRTALIPAYREAEADRVEAEPDASEEGAAEAVSAPAFPEELLGTWEGRIVAYDREIGVTLLLRNDEEATITLSEQEERSVDLSVVSSDFLLGTFQGSIPTPDIARYDHSVRLALVRTGDRLAGQATAVGRREDRQTDSELSSWIELQRK